MPDVKDARGLLLMALRDLYDAETAMVERLPGLSKEISDDVLRALAAREAERSAEQREIVGEVARAMGEDAGGARNIWLRGILDDADNDVRSIAKGMLLDVALTGALRKGKQSERVSYETAIALALRLGLAEEARRLSAICAQEAETDERLAETLDRLCSAA